MKLYKISSMFVYTNLVYLKFYTSYPLCSTKNYDYWNYTNNLSLIISLIVLKTVLTIVAWSLILVDTFYSHLIEWAISQLKLLFLQ